MRSICALALAALTAVLPVPIPAQQTPPATSSTPIVRDPQSLGLLQQALASAGITASVQVQDFTETGSITYFWAGQEVSGSVTLRGLGVTAFRLDATLSDESQNLSWAVSNGQGSIKQANGKTTVIPTCDGMNAGVLTLPHLAITTAINDPTVSVSAAAQVTLNERSTYDIRVQQTFSQKADPSGQLAKCSSKDYLIDAATLALIETRDTVYPNDAPIGSGVSHEVIFSDYRPMNGTAVPFSITEKLAGQQTWAIQVSAVNFNTGLTPDIFQY